MTYGEYITPISKQHIIQKLNKITVENDTDTRKNLIVELYSLDHIHTPYAANIQSPLYIFEFQKLMNDKREPTDTEYEEFINSRIDDFKYKLKNMEENKKKLTNTRLRNTLYNMYFETDLLKRMEVLMKYIVPIKKIKKPPQQSKQEIINILKKNDIYRIGSYAKMENATRATLLKYIPQNK